MRISINGRLFGVGVGALCGLLFVTLGWQAFLILVAFTVGGLLVGVWIDLGGRIKRQLAGLIERVLRS